MKMARKNTIKRVRTPVEQKRKMCINPAQYFVTESLKRIDQRLPKLERRKLVSDCSDSGNNYQNQSSLHTRKNGNSLFYQEILEI